MNLWNNYKEVLGHTFDLTFTQHWANWSSNGAELRANLYTHPYFIKMRETEVWDSRCDIYNTIIYPKTGSNLPCFGVDLMKFSEKKVIIVFDYQHPVENYMFSVDGLPKQEGNIRFFEPGNHFSENIYVAKCAPSEVDEHLDMFKKYLTKFKDMVECKKPTGEDTAFYSDFDKYMKKLDPVAGFLSQKFGKEKTGSFIDEFLFCYD